MHRYGGIFQIGSRHQLAASEKQEISKRKSEIDQVKLAPRSPQIHFFFELIKIALMLGIVTLLLIEHLLASKGGVFKEYETELLSLQLILVVCLIVWCGTFIFLTFKINNLPLICMLLIAVVAYFISFSKHSLATDGITILAGVTLGKGASFVLKIGNRKSEIGKFLFGLVVLLALSSWWHLDETNNYYHGPRWMGLWDNPNTYGMLMGVGVVLAIGMLCGNIEERWMKDEAGRQKPEGESLNEAKRKVESGKQRLIGDVLCRPLSTMLFIAALMLWVGLIFSYSRGAWVGTIFGLLYLAKAYRKFKWRWVLPLSVVTLSVVCFFWNNTTDTAPWYLKRIDFGRASSQHRIAAWKAGLEIMRDHPFGVGWNKAVDIYQKDYSPPENGAAAINTNDYLMLGTQLGLPGLLCFITYICLCFRRNHFPTALFLRGAVVPTADCDGVLPSAPVRTPGERKGETPTLLYSCRAGAFAMLVAFWFDGGLFRLVTASMFWILLEVGTEWKPRVKDGMLMTSN